MIKKMVTSNLDADSMMINQEEEMETSNQDVALMIKKMVNSSQDVVLMMIVNQSAFQTTNQIVDTENKHVRISGI